MFDHHNSPVPPKLAQRLLLCVLKEELAEEILGDLDEKYQKELANNSITKAKLNYWYQTFNYLRPFAIKKLILPNLNPSFMYQHNFKVSFRNLKKNKGFALINIGGLAMGMMVVLLIGLWIWDEFSYDHYNQNYDRITQVMRHQNWRGERITSHYLPSAMGNVLKEKYTGEFEYVVMARKLEESILSFGDRHFSELGNFMESSAPALLDLQIKQGTGEGLKDMNTILLSESLAKKIFSQQNPIDQTLKIYGAVEVIVRGVYKDIPRNSKFHQTSFIAPLDLYFSMFGLDPNTWENYNMNLYAQVRSGVSFTSASEAIEKEFFNHIEKEKAENRQPTLFLHPMDKWRLHGEFENGQYTQSKRMQLVLMIGLIGLFVLFLACINFINLSTARAQKRLKEIGVRKSIGSNRFQLINQFLSESILIVCISYGLALGMAILLLPWFNDLSEKSISFPFAQPVFWLITLGAIVFTGLIAGSYPAFYLSSFKAVKAIKGIIYHAGNSTINARKGLVIFQFSISTVLIIGTLIINQHIQHGIARPMGYTSDKLLMIPKQVGGLYGKQELFREELKKTGSVIEIANADYPLTNTRGSNTGFEWTGKDSSIDPAFNTVHIDTEYGKTIDWELIAGRDFSKERGDNKNGVIITESAQKILGFENPIGQTVHHDDFGKDDFTIIGVVKDLVKESPFQSTPPSILFFSEEELPWMFIRLAQEADIKTALADVKAIFQIVAPDAPFDYKFVDSEYQAKFREELQIKELAIFFSFFAILISCLGVFGLSTFLAERRIKEIGIRKILGASRQNIWQLLSKDFVVLVLISCIIAIPIAWYLSERWLANYEYRPEISFSVFLLAILGTFLVTLGTVSVQALRAASLRPVNSLNTE